MSTTVKTLQAGYPVPKDGSLTKVYWRLPVLREGTESVHARRADDIFLNLFASVVDDSRTELKHLLKSVGRRPVGLFGFSIGSLIALWGAVDNPQVGAVVTVGGVPSLDYLQHYYRNYPWSDASIAARLKSYAVSPHIDRLASVPTLLSHGDADDVAKWEWMQEFAETLMTVSPKSRIQKFPHMRHRLHAETPEEQRELEHLRKMADQWFVDHLS
nr:dienelactone hydrolase family protein [Sulfobacillus harzensis]